MILLEGSNLLPIGAHQVQDWLLSLSYNLVDRLFSSSRSPVLVPIEGRQRIQLHVVTYGLMFRARVLFCG